jgi:hypothetical protein
MELTFQHFMEPEGSLPVDKSPPLVPILSQIDPVHATSSCLSKIECTIELVSNVTCG